MSDTLDILGGNTPRQRIVTEALRWLGTPYHHHGRLRGIGVDCAMLLCEVMHAAGLVDRQDPGVYPTDWHLHRDDERFEAHVLAAGGRRIDVPAVGDVGLLRYGRAYAHGAIVVDVEAGVPVLVHAYVGRGVIRSRLSDAPVAGRPVRWYTLIPSEA